MNTYALVEVEALPPSTTGLSTPNGKRLSPRRSLTKAGLEEIDKTYGRVVNKDAKGRPSKESMFEAWQEYLLMRPLQKEDAQVPSDVYSVLII